MEQELPTFPVHLSSPLVFSEVCVAQSLVFCVVFCRSFFVPLLLSIVLSVLLFMASAHGRSLGSNITEARGLGREAPQPRSQRHFK